MLKKLQKMILHPKGQNLKNLTLRSWC